MEIQDFAAALRAMADNVDVLAERHDVAKMARLQQLVVEQSGKAQRDTDLIDELRRQVQAMGRSLDAIGRLRKNHLAEPADSVQILAEALLIIGGTGCSSYHSGWSCRQERSGRSRVAECTAEAWCPECVARDALERAGALPPAVD